MWAEGKVSRKFDEERTLLDNKQHQTKQHQINHTLVVLVMKYEEYDKL